VWDIALVEGHKLSGDSPGMSHAEFRHRLKNIIDEIFDLPPIAEEISDIVIAVVIDSVCWRIRETKSPYALVTREWMVYAKECVSHVEGERAKKAKKKETKK